MGYDKHHVIVVTHSDKQLVVEAHEMAKHIFDKHLLETGRLPIKMVSPIVEGVVNSQYSFLVGPDGSKEGWEDSDKGDAARAEFVAYLKDNPRVDFVEVMFGGDYEDSKILNDNAYRE